MSEIRLVFFMVNNSAKEVKNQSRMGLFSQAFLILLHYKLSSKSKEIIYFLNCFGSVFIPLSDLGF